MLSNNENSHPNRNIYLCGIVFLGILALLSYLPGFASVTQNEYQPSLVTMDFWEDGSLDTLSGHYGWEKAYLHQTDSNHEYDSDFFTIKFFNNDIHNAGRAYIFLSGISFGLLLLSMLGISCKNKYCISILMMLSWLSLLIAVVIYTYNFHNSAKDFMGELSDIDYHWRFGSGLIFNVVGLLLLPAINIMLCV